MEPDNNGHKSKPIDYFGGGGHLKNIKIQINVFNPNFFFSIFRTIQTVIVFILGYENKPRL